MLIKVLVNGKEKTFVSKETVVSKAISKLRQELKTKYKKNKQKCELWFTDVIIK